MNRTIVKSRMYNEGGKVCKETHIRQLLNSKKIYLAVKRVFDILFSLIVIIFFLTWLFPVIALLIKLTSKGPVLFIQRRVGYLGRTFHCLKFRTMVLNNDANIRQATTNDPRITKLGKYLRNSNLDELPQFFNVLKGDMSVIGPRPHMHADCRRFASMIPGYKLRNLVRPGITGLAQVKGCRGPACDFQPAFRRFQWDNFYVRNFNFNLDMRILRLTITSTFTALFSRIHESSRFSFKLPVFMNSARTKVTVKRSKEEAYEMIANLFPVMNSEQRLPKVSAVIITYNEEKIIRKTLKQLSWCDEIVIVDSGSIDRTVDFCNESGCIIHHRTFNGFGEQKKYGVSVAKNDWILCLDADEVLSDSLIDEIKEELMRPTVQYVGFSMPRNLVFMDQVFRFGRESRDSVIRLFNRSKGNWDGAIVHEKVELLGPIKTMKNKILHYSYTDYSQFIRKIDLYSSLGAQRFQGKKKKKSRALIILSVPYNFFKYYILDRNFLNGFQGFTWSSLNACYHLLKYLKLRQLQTQVIEMPLSGVTHQPEEQGKTTLIKPAAQSSLKHVMG